MLCESQELTQVQETLLLLQKNEVTPGMNGMNAEPAMSTR